MINIYALVKKIRTVPIDDLIRYKEIVCRYEETIYDEYNVKDNLLNVINDELKRRKS